jgi:hypothetical protein
MPSYSSSTVGYESPGPQHDHEHWPVGHYRGRGNRQDHTGPNGPWLEGGPARYMRQPRARHEHIANRDNRPKGYVRSDARIFEHVCEMLTDHGDIDASDIEVTVDEGDVILRGTVRSRWARYYTEDLVLAVDGVRDVVNELRIARNPDGSEVGGPTTDGGGGQLPKLHYP